MKKLTILLFSLVFLMLLLSLSAAADGIAEDVEFSCYKVADAPTDVTARVSDVSYTTSTQVNVGEVLEFTPDGAASYIYLKFYGEAPKGGYTLRCYDGFGNESVLKCGENGYLHDTEMLPENTFRVLLSADVTFSLAEAQMFTSGTLPDEVQRWETVKNECDILILATHADDDTLFFGALAAENVAKQRLVQTAVLVNHGGELHRRNELLDGQWALGIKSYPIIGEYPDLYSMSLNNARNQYKNYDILGFIVETIRKSKPQVVVTHDFMGEYGHGAHRLLAALTSEAIELAARFENYPESAEVYGVHEPIKTYIHNYDENAILLDVDAVYEALGNRSPFEVATDAYSCHKSQQKWDFAVTKNGTDDCRTFGLYKTNVECDLTSNDMMNGVTPAVQEVSVPQELNTDAKMLTKVGDIVLHNDYEHSELLHILYEDSNGNETKAPVGAVAFCIAVVILFVLYLFILLLKRAIRKR